MLRVLKRLGMHGTRCFGLQSEHAGGLVVPSSQRKLGAMAFHTSQRVHDDLTQWGNTTLYTPLIVGAETYAEIMF